MCVQAFAVGAMAIRLAVVGAGPLVGQAHCKIIKEMGAEDVELACICQRRADDTKMSELLGVPLYTDAKEMARNEHLDGVVIAAPTHVHLAVTKDVIEGSKLRQADLERNDAKLPALLIEKPICEDLASAVELLGITEAAGMEVLVGHQRRHSSYVRRARELVTDKNFGPLRGLNMEFSLLKPDSYFCSDNPANAWRRKKGVGGPLLINSIHDVDLMRYITGHEITQVFAMMSNGARGGEVEDSGAITVTFDHGAVGTLFFTDAAPAPWSYEFTTCENKKYPVVPGTETRDCYHFMGAQRSLGFPSLRSFTYSPSAEREPGWDCPMSVEHSPVKREDPLQVQMHHFAKICQGEEKPVCSGRDAVESLAVLMAVLRSAESGRPVAPSEMLAEVNKAAVVVEPIEAGDIKSLCGKQFSMNATTVPTGSKLDDTSSETLIVSDLCTSVVA